MDIEEELQEADLVICIYCFAHTSNPIVRDGFTYCDESCCMRQRQEDLEWKDMHDFLD